MGRAEATETIDAPRGDLFHFTDWCYNDPKWAPSIRKAWITKLPDSDGRGKISHYVGTIMGRGMEWEGESVKWKMNELWSMRAISGLPAKMNMLTEMRFEPEGPNKTKVTVSIEFRTPYPLIGWFVDKFYLSRQAKRMARNGVVGMSKAASLGKIPPLKEQMERRKADHPGYGGAPR
jgi:uncharacterized membrane protein